MHFLKTLLVLPLLLIVYLHPVCAQQKAVGGRLVDEAGKGISFAAVSLYRLSDSTLVKSSLADSLGAFHFTGIQADHAYFLKISAVGFTPYQSTSFLYNDHKNPHLLADIVLASDNVVLEEVVISGNPPLIDQQLDKIVLNVEQSLLAAGNNVLELLRKTPGVTAGDDGSVSLRGRDGATVMLNGKPTYLSSLQLANLLRGMRAEHVQRIEIMNNPSARYDAAGNGGIINIVLKKQLKSDLNGSFSINGGMGRGAILGASASLNYRSEQVNFYGSYDQYYQNMKSFDEITRYYFDDNKQAKQLSEQSTRTEPRLRSNNFRAGVDFFLNERNTIGFLINGGFGKYPTMQPTVNNLSNLPDKTLVWQAHTITEGKERWEDLLYNINFQHQFTKVGHTLTADLDYVYHHDRMDQQLDSRYLDAFGEPIRPRSSRIGNIPSNNDIYVAKVDYSLPFASKGKLEAGWKSSYVKTENNLQYDTLFNNVYVYDASTSNHFIYKEQIHAAYANVKDSWGKLTLQFGLRGEYTGTKGEQVTTDSIFERSYFKLFPSAFAAFSFNENNTLQFGFSKRIQRPSYWDLNPFRIYVDPFSYYEGNAQLLPAYVNSFEMGYQYRSFLNVALNYNRSTDVVSSIVGVLDNSNITYQKPANIGVYVNYGLSITATTVISPWWSGTQFLNVYRNQYSIHTDQQQVERAGNTLTLNSQHTFALAKGWKAELSAFYLSGQVTGVSKLRSYHTLSVGVQKNLMQDKASIKLMVNDIFRGNQFKREQRYGNVAIYSLHKADSRNALLSFTYRFGRAGDATEKRRTGSEDLKDRIK